MWLFVVSSVQTYDLFNRLMQRWNRADNSFAITHRLLLGQSKNRISIPGNPNKLFSSPPRPDLLQCPPSLIGTGYWRLLLRGQSGWSVNLTTYLYLVRVEVRIELNYNSTPKYLFLAWYRKKFSLLLV